MLFIQFLIISLTLLIWFICVTQKKIPHGLIEWVLTILSIGILISWAINYYR